MKTIVWFISLPLFTRAKERRLGFYYCKIERGGIIEIRLKEGSLGHPQAIEGRETLPSRFLNT